MLSRFDIAYILTVPKRLEQAKILESQIQQRGCNTSIFLVGTDSIDDPSRHQRFNYQNSFFTILDKVINSGLSNYLFVEDDADIRDNFDIICPLSLSELPNDWDMLYFGANHEDNYNFLVSDHLMRSTKALDLHFVAINQTMYQKLINCRTNLEAPLDLLVAETHKNNKIYTVYPHIVYQKTDYNHFGGYLDKTYFHSHYGNLQDWRNRDQSCIKF